MATQKLFAMLSLNSDEGNNSNTDTNYQQKWRSLLINKRVHKSCTDDYSSLRSPDDNNSSILQQPIEIFHYLRQRKSSIDTSFIDMDRRSSSRGSRKSSLKANDSVFLNDTDGSYNFKRDRLTKQRQVERFYQNKSLRSNTTPQSPYQNNVSIEHFQFDLYSTSLIDEQADNESPSWLSGKICGELFGYVHYHIEIEQLELKLISVSVDYTKTDKKESIQNMFVRIQLIPHKVDAFISSLMKGENECQWNSSWVTNVTFEESQQATAQFLIRTLTKGNIPRSLGAAEVDLRKLDIINGENFKENIYSGKLNDELGEIQVSLSYAPDLKQMTMLIGKVRNLVKKDFFKKPDTFVKMSLYNNKKLLKSKKTSVKRSTYNPVFNESFVFDINDGQLSQLFVVVSIYEKHSTSKNDCMGRLIFGAPKKASCSLQAEHWAETIGSSWNTVARWHQIISKDKCSSISSVSSDDNKI